MSEKDLNLEKFIKYAKSCDGDEKGEAQVFLDRLFIAFGHAGYKEAGAKLEYRVRKKGERTKFADLRWGNRVLIEMKSKGENLEKHVNQALEYWLRIHPDKPRFVILCNFTDFWIYEFGSQLEPLEKIGLNELVKRQSSFKFLSPKWDPKRKIIFSHNLVDVTREAADQVAQVFNSLIERKVDRNEAQLFILQCVFALFAEDIGLLEKEFFTRLLLECAEGASTYDLLGGLFRQMDKEKKAPHGMYKNVDYFDGGLFRKQVPLELNKKEINYLLKASSQDWSKVQPPIFGAIFESSMDEKERHAWGAHYTREADILKVVLPTIVQPWRKRIERTKTLKQLEVIRDELCSYRVLDPACGSGNFLYVAYRALKRLESELLLKINTQYKSERQKSSRKFSRITLTQFYGIDNNEFAVELAKVTLVIAKKLAFDEASEFLQSDQLIIPLQLEKPLPLDNLDDNIQCEDALFCDWPRVEAIVGNPPFQAKKNLRDELGHKYVNELRKKYPSKIVSGRADYCVYWFRLAHEALGKGKRAGLIGTNHIRRTYSRKSGLDFIINNGGTITEAVATQVWPGDSDVHVSIVNWVKGEQKGKKKLYTQHGDSIDSPWQLEELDFIHGGLSSSFDVGQAKEIEANQKPKKFFQGQTHGNDGFLLSIEETDKMIRKDSKSKEVLIPYLIGADMLGRKGSLPSRYVIDLNHCEDVVEASKYREAFKHLEKFVLPDIKEAAEKERDNPDDKSKDRQRHFKRWWCFWRSRKQLIEAIEALPRYIAFSRHMKHSICEFIHPSIHPNDALQIFALEDDYSYGILQSEIYALWSTQKGGSLTARSRMTPEMGFKTFPWPQKPVVEKVKKVAKAARELRVLRRKIMNENDWNFRKLYSTMDVPGKNSVKEAINKLNKEVRTIYGIGSKDDVLEFLWNLNTKVSLLEGNQKPVVGPGLPNSIKNRQQFISDDCIGKSVFGDVE